MFSQAKEKMKFLSLLTVFALTFSLMSAVGCAKNDSIPPSATRISAPEVDAAEPAIAADADGNVYIVYVEHGADKTADVYLQKIGADGKLNGEKTRVNPEKGTAKAWRGDPPTIKIGGDDTIFIGWTAKIAGAEISSASDLNLSVSRDGGKTFAAPIKVNDDVLPAAHGMHSLEIGKDNRVFVAWLDERNLKIGEQAESAARIEEEIQNASPFQFVKILHHNSNQANKNSRHQMENGTTQMKDEVAEPNSEVFFAVSDDGGETFSANKKLSSEVCPCCKTSLLAAPDGRIYASWRQVLGDNFRHIAVAS